MLVIRSVTKVDENGSANRVFLWVGSGARIRAVAQASYDAAGARLHATRVFLRRVDFRPLFVATRDLRGLGKRDVRDEQIRSHVCAELGKVLQCVWFCCFHC